MARSNKMCLLLRKWDHPDRAERRERKLLSVLLVGSVLLGLWHPEAGLASSVLVNLRWIWD